MAEVISLMNRKEKTAMDKNNVEWKEFFLEDVVTIGNGVRLTKSDMENGDTPFIGASEMNNGITAYCVNRNDSYDNNLLGVNYNGSVGFSFYHPYYALFSDDVKRVKWKDTSKNNKYTLLFLAVSIQAQKDKYAYGYKFNSQRMKRQKILLPINDYNEPNYEYMLSFMQKVEQDVLKATIRILKEKLNHCISNVLTSEVQWKIFNFVDVFDIRKGFYNKKPPCFDDGNIPFIGASDSNNGVTGFTDYNTIEANSKIGYGKNEPIEMKLFPGNAICVTNNGSVGYAYYQVNDFTCTHDVNPLYLKEQSLNRHIALFLIGCIEKQRVCFTYARKWRPKRMLRSKLLLPFDTNGNPNWNYMENYMRQLEYNIITSYLNLQSRNNKSRIDNSIISY